MKTKRRLVTLSIMLILSFVFCPSKVKADDETPGVPIGYQKYGQYAEEIYHNDLDFLALIVWAEAGNQPLTGKRLVVDVVLNRMNDPRFPDTIREVITQPGQFSTNRQSIIRRAASNVTDECYTAVALETRERTDPDILFFSAGSYLSYGQRAYKYGDHYFRYLLGAGEARHDSIDDYYEDTITIEDTEGPMEKVQELYLYDHCISIYDSVSNPYIKVSDLNEYFNINVKEILSSNDIFTENYYPDTVIEKGSLTKINRTEFVKISGVRKIVQTLKLEDNYFLKELEEIISMNKLEYIVVEPEEDTTTFNLIRWNDIYGWVGYYYKDTGEIIAYKLDQYFRIVKEIK